MKKAIFNHNKLKGRIVEMCGTQEKFAQKMGMDRSSLNLAINGKRDFSQTEISKSIKILDILPEEIAAYFFTQ